jgi:hypothetical protein
MEIDDPTYFNLTLSSLNNNAGLLLLHMGSLGRPLTQSEMRGITGMSPKTLNDTLALLTHRRLIEKNSSTSKLTAAAWATLTACCGRPQEAAAILRCSEHPPASDEKDGTDSAPQAQNLRPPAVQHPQPPTRDENNGTESASQAQNLRPFTGSASPRPAGGKNDDRESANRNRIPSPGLEPALIPPKGSKNDNRESVDWKIIPSRRPARPLRHRALSLQRWPALNKLKKQKELKDLKNLKIFKILSTTTTNPSIENSSSSNILNARERDSEIIPAENGTSPPKNEPDLQPGDILLPDELTARLSSYLSGDPQHPGPLLFEQHPFASRLDFLLRHAPAIATTRFPLDDHLDQHDRTHGTQTKNAAFKLLYLAGIRGIMLSGLANRIYATPDYVRALMAKSRSIGDRSIINLTIRIEQHEPARAIDPITGHLMDCNCPVCSPAMHRVASQYRSLDLLQDTF